MLFSFASRLFLPVTTRTVPIHQEDMEHFHGTYKKVCDKHDPEYYAKFKKVSWAVHSMTFIFERAFPRFYRWMLRLVSCSSAGLQHSFPTKTRIMSGSSLWLREGSRAPCPEAARHDTRAFLRFFCCE